MTVPASVEAVAIIVLLFIPGYIFLQFTREAVAFVPQSADARYLFAVITWGGIIHLVFFAWTQSLLDAYLNQSLGSQKGEAALWCLVVLVLAPLGFGLAASWTVQLPWIDTQLKRIGFDYVSRTPSAWNYATKLGPHWMRVHLKDGTIIGGSYDQYASADDAGEKDLYLSRVYNLDSNGDFLDEVRSSAGVWISHSEISHIMLYGPDRKGD